MSRSYHDTKWVKFGNIDELVFLSDDVMAVASGIHVMFINLISGEERIERFDNAERGIGASCLAGHPIVPMFATAERRSRPKIFIFTYPGIRKVTCCLLENGPNSYLSSVFAGTDYLLALTGFPNFKIVVWLWRTGEYMTEIDTGIFDNEQRIISCPSSPYLISQLGKTSSKLAIYEVSVCSRIVTISRISGSSMTSNTVCSSWTNDGNIFNCDATGNVSLMSSDSKRCLLVVREQNLNNTQESNGRPLIESFGTGVVVVNRQSQIIFYRKSKTEHRVKSGSPWHPVWSVQAKSHPVASARCPHRDSLLFCGKHGEIFEVIVEEDSPRLRVISYQGSKYKFLMGINPRNEYIGAIDEFDKISVFLCQTGKFMGNLCLKRHGSVRCVTSHPTAPIIALCTNTGKFIIVNLTLPAEPSLVRVIHLQRETLEKIRFSFAGKKIGIADCLNEKLFIIGENDNDKYSVLGLLISKIKIIDFLVYENDEKNSKILILAKTSKFTTSGYRVFVYYFEETEDKWLQECIIEYFDIFNSLNYGRDKNEIIVVPYLTKQLHIIRIQENYQGLTLTEAFASGHQLRNIKISLNASYVVTCGYDGLIIIRSTKNIHKASCVFMSHLRFNEGTKFAILSSANSTIVSLGRNGDLIATGIRNLEAVSNAATIDDLLISRESNENIETNDLTWIEKRFSENLRIERESCAAERDSIRRDFFQLREKLKSLLDANSKESPNAQLQISDFDLDVKTREKLIHDNIKNQKELSSRLEKEILNRDRVAKYVYDMCWETMEIAACSLISINGKIKVDNFPIARMTKEQLERRKWERLTVDFNPYEKRLPKKEQNISNENLTIIGTTTHRWISKECSLLTNQIRKFSGYVEGKKISILIIDEERKLKLYFNKLFEDMKAIKERELNLAAERIEEINRCSLELKNTFGIELVEDKTISQPLWHYSEKPETIVTVSDNEILLGRAATFLERDTRSELLRKEAEENFKLNDPFREKALNAMMDGLLEVRWEDEIKKDPPKPECLSKGESSRYTQEEIDAIEAYHEKCRELKVQREKYKKILKDKIASVKEALSQGIEAFDRKLETFYLDRMKIESAVFQETLMRLRESQRSLLRRRGMEKMEKAQNDLASAIKEYRSLNEISNSLEIVITDTRNRYENLTKRDKIFETKLRGEFLDLKQPIVEHLLRHYRKRPKNVQLTCTSITYLTEIVRCIVTGEKSEILPRDCLDFLRSMDSLDLMPNNLPAQIDSNHWNVLCKLRRAKVELEVKITSCAVDLAEAEQTLASYQKACLNAENKISLIKETIKDLEMKQSELFENMKIQLVIKMGQIEAQLYGNQNELSNAVFVPFSVVEKANNEIIIAGKKKLAAMRKTIEYRRTILWQEWRHKCMKITLDDMKEELKVLQGVKVTKEIQNYLCQSHNTGMEIETRIRERKYASWTERYKKIVEEKKNRLIDTNKKVIFWNKQNKRLALSIEKKKLASFNASMLANDESRKREIRYRRIKLKSIMKRTRMTKKVIENYNELMALHTQLELLRLKTYPTLRLQGHLAKGKNVTNRRTN